MKRGLSPFFLSLIVMSTMSSQQTSISPRDLAELHEAVKVADISSRHFTQRQLIAWLDPAVKQGTVTGEVVGSSGEGRSISVYTYGSGPVSVLLWSQMHGDEPTATMALVDLVAFFHTKPDHPLSRLIREGLTLLMIPMLNPDGAERFTRRTSQGIDMNRDAMRLATPEARLLKDVRGRFRPHFGFNLHDQDPRYTVGTTGHMTAIALLAPPTDESRGDNDVRRRAKQVAAITAEALQSFIPGKVARWDDTFEPRAFGDNVQRWGTSTILIESGGWPGDRNKMHLRKVNFVALLSAFQAIVKNKIESTNLQAYEGLPFNMRLGCDVLLRNVRLRPSPKADAVPVDVAFNVDETNGGQSLKVTITDVGDLSTFVAFETIDGSGMDVDAALVKDDNVITYDQFKSLVSRK